MIISDITNISKIITTERRGYVQRNYSEEPQGLHGVAAPFAEPLIPRAEWPDLIADMLRTKSRLSDLLTDAGIGAYHQGNTNYCWAHSLVFCVQVVRAIQGQPTVRLSAASVAAPATGYANVKGSPAGVGGWNAMALKWLVQHGVASENTWPRNSTNKGNWDNSAEDRAKYNVTEWDDLKPNNFDQLMTTLLRRRPVGTAHMWMRHAVTAIDPIYDAKSKQFGYLAYNSGYLRDANGRTVIMGNRAIPDEAISPRVAFAS